MRIHRSGHAGLPPLLLIHGLSSSHRGWERNIATLGRGRRLLLVELFPATAGPRFDVRSAAASLEQALGTEATPAAVIGHSLGGLVALQLALGAPQLVDRLVLVATPAVRVRRSRVGRLRSLATAGAGADLRSVALVTTTLATANPAQLVAATYAAMRADLAGQATALAVPTLVVWGEADGIVPPAVGEALVKAIPGARRAVIPGAGHQPHWESPQAFDAAVLPFLEETAR